MRVQRFSDRAASMPAGRAAALRAWLLLAGVAGAAMLQVAAAKAERPSGVLDGRIVYLHAGHGWTADNLGSGSWTTQRGETFEIVEDLNNADLIATLADRLWNAGATVVPLRPIGQQVNEVVLDNDDASVEFIGPWFDSGASLFFGSPGDAPYRFAQASASETAVARYRPDLPEAGFYPVYTWVTHGGNRVDQLYRVHHTGGVTEVRVDHRKVGNGLVWLGTYWFDAGDAGFVEISNEADGSGVVIADMIRFGNGVGDIDRGGGVSGRSRADEAGLYWVMWHADRAQGVLSSDYRVSSSDGSATINLAPIWSAYMNREQSGTLADRVMLSYHTNAGGGSARGVLGLVNGNNIPSTATPNQFELAFLVAAEVNDDLVSLNGSFEHDWADRTVLTLDRTDFEFGEINNSFINDEFDATIIELAFHDNQLDAELLRDPKVQDALNRAVVQGLVRYFSFVDAGATPTAFPPAEPEAVSATAAADGSVTVRWSPPVFGPAVGDPATGYRVQTSPDGLGFGEGVPVPGGSASSVVINDPDPGRPYLRVVATNAAGWSRPSAVVGASLGDGPAGAPVRGLIINGFTRLERTQNPREPYFSGTIDRVRPRRSNTFDYIGRVGEALRAAAPGVGFDSAEASAVSASGGAGKIAPFGYDFVIWFVGEESSAQATLTPMEQGLASAILASGSDLFLTGSEIARDLDFLGNGVSFYNSVLGASFVADDAGSYTAFGPPGSLFDGLTISFDDRAAGFDADTPDEIMAINGAVPQMFYLGGTTGVAAVARENAVTGVRLIHFGFPIIAIPDPASRAAVMERVLGYFGALPSTCVGDTTTDGANPGDAGFGEADGAVTAADLTYFVERWIASETEADLTTDGANPGDLGFGEPDGSVTASDLTFFVEAWISGCP